MPIHLTLSGELISYRLEKFCKVTTISSTGILPININSIETILNS